MHGSKKTHKSWLKNYKVAKVFNNGRLYTQTLKYLKNKTILITQKYYFFLIILLIKNIQFVMSYCMKKNSRICWNNFFPKKYNKKILNCNIHSWMVDTNHRIGSSMLINQIKQNCIITVLSSLPRLEKTFLKLGFKKFNMKYKIIFIKKFFAKNIKLSFDILHNQNFLMKKTNKSQQKIIKDYNNSRFKKFIFFNSISKKIA